jgi:hypothetical protein
VALKIVYGAVTVGECCGHLSPSLVPFLQRHWIEWKWASLDGAVRIESHQWHPRPKVVWINLATFLFCYDSVTVLLVLVVVAAAAASSIWT